MVIKVTTCNVSRHPGIRVSLSNVAAMRLQFSGHGIVSRIKCRDGPKQMVPKHPLKPFPTTNTSDMIREIIPESTSRDCELFTVNRESMNRNR
ncbi:hypothetical protein J6590_016986 [Homalodisca vitripennis]|nr:hypothetical protein J6590_016986 [Homalodisca vitripennis]